MSFQDNKSYRYVLEDNITDEIPEKLDPDDDYVDTYKVSHCQNIKIGNKAIVNSNEDCIDIVGCKNVVFENCLLWPWGRTGIVVKGASENIWLGVGFAIPGNECEVEIGNFDNYWYPGRKPTRLIYINGSLDLDKYMPNKVRITVYDGEEIKVSPALNPEFIIIPKWKWFPYFLLRYATLRVTNLYRKITGGKQIDTNCYKTGSLQPC